MKIKNQTPSHKIKNSKSFLSSTIKYIKNDLNSENINQKKSSKQQQKIAYEDEKNNKENISNIPEQINQKQSNHIL